MTRSPTLSTSPSTSPSPTSFLSARAALALIVLVWAIGVTAGIVQRWSYIGVMTEGHHQWLMAEETKFVEYWERNGIWAERMLTLESPKSIEAQTLHERIIYTSFLPGCTLQLYLAHQLFRDLPIPTLISFYGIAQQALMALIMGILVWRMMEPRDRGGIALFFVGSAMLTYLFHPAPYYFHPMVHMGQISVLLPYLVALCLEYSIRRSGNSPQRADLHWWLGLATGWMAANHWLFIPFCVMLCVFRVVSPLPGQYQRGVLRGLIHTGLMIWTLPVIIVLAYAWNLHQVGMLQELFSRFMIRIGHSNGEPAGPARVWEQFFVYTLGNSGWWLLAGGLVSLVFLRRDRHDPVAVLSLISLLTALLYVFLLPNDVVAHDFLQLFFFVPLSIVAFGIAPYRAIWQLNGTWMQAAAPRFACVGLFAFLWGFYMIHFRSDWQDWHQHRPPATQQLAEWLRAHATYEDVYVTDSPALEIADNPPVPVAISYKRVWLQPTPEALQAFVGKLPAAAKPHLVSKTDYTACFAPAAPSALPDGSHLYRLDRDTPQLIDCLAARWPKEPAR